MIIIITKFTIKWSRKNRKPRIEMFNLKNKEYQKKFTALISKTNILTSVFDSNSYLDIAIRNFFKNLDKCIQMCFKKIRITENTKDEINDLFDKRGLLRNKTDDKSKHDLEEVKLRLAELCSKKNYEKLNPKLISW